MAASTPTAVSPARRTAPPPGAESSNATSPQGSRRSLERILAPDASPGVGAKKTRCARGAHRAVVKACALEVLRYLDSESAWLCGHDIGLVVVVRADVGEPGQLGALIGDVGAVHGHLGTAAAGRPGREIEQAVGRLEPNHRLLVPLQMGRDLRLVHVRGLPVRRPGADIVELVAHHRVALELRYLR